MIACFALVFGYHGEGRGEITGGALAELAAYVDECLVDLAQKCSSKHPLTQALRGFVADVEGLKEGESLDLRPADYF